MAEREWREASDLRVSILGISLIVVSGALLRFWNLRNGGVTPIEREIIDPVVQLLHTGSYRPLALTRPTLPLYLQAAVATVHFLWGAVIGRWPSTSAFQAEQVITWGRACSALLGTAVVFVVYQIGARWGARHALLAAGLMAVMPTHVAASREIGDGSPLTFFTALTLLLSLAACERKHRRAFAAAGAAAGLAAGSHYAGALTIMLPLVAAWMTRSDESSRPSRASAAVLAAIAAFVIVTPLAVTDLPAFLNGFALAAAPAMGETGGIVTIDLFQELLSALQWPGLILAFAGLSLAVVRTITGPGHTRWTLLATFPLVYFALLSWHGAISGTIVLPMLPAVTVLAAIAVISGVSQLRRFDIPRAVRTALIAALTVAAVLPPAVLSVELVRQAGRNMPEGVRVSGWRNRDR
jgi:4-amino-4-deoxy-L-arabinose transferase-like glycosyltransferase